MTEEGYSQRMLKLRRVVGTHCKQQATAVRAVVATEAITGARGLLRCEPRSPISDSVLRGLESFRSNIGRLYWTVLEVVCLSPDSVNGLNTLVWYAQGSSLLYRLSFYTLCFVMTNLVLSHKCQ